MGQAQHGTEPTLVVLVNYILPPATKGLILAAPDLPGALNMTERGGSGMHLVATKENLKLWGERKHARAAARRYSHHQVGSFMHCSSTTDALPAVHLWLLRGLTNSVTQAPAADTLL